MMRLQRGLLRSDAAAAGTGAGGDASAFGLILALDFAAAAGEAVAGGVESGVGALAVTPAAGTAGAGSGLGAMVVEACDSLTVFSDAAGAVACFGIGGETVGSIVA